MTRAAILAIFRPGQRATESPFRTLRHHGCASQGLRVGVRTSMGQVLGRAHLYGSLNADAARAARQGNFDLAQLLAKEATKMEASPHARTIRDAIGAVASTVGVDPGLDDAPLALRRYLRLRSRSSWRGLDRNALVRDWLLSSEAWLSQDEHGELSEATAALAQAANEVRADLLPNASPSVTTFYGVVRRLDVSAVEVEGSTETRLVPRDTLEREGLATIGTAVALLCEVLPVGGTLVLPMPAAAIDAGDEHHTPSTPSPWAAEHDGAFWFQTGSELEPSGAVTVIGRDDEAWIKRALAREPTAVPFAPLRRG